MLILEEVYKEKMSKHSAFFNLRMQRSLSWLKKSIQLGSEWEMKFMSLWISFTSLYQQDEKQQNDQDLSSFLEMVYCLDLERKIENLLWNKYQQHVIKLIGNPYLHQTFWDYQHSKISQQQWQLDYEQQKIEINSIQQQHDTYAMLDLVFARLGTQHRQIAQGGSSANSSIYKKQMIECCNIMTALSYAFIFILLEDTSFNLSTPYYPVTQFS